MQFVHDAAARLLVQPVDVLRDDGGEPALALPLREFFVRRVGLRVQAQHFIAVERVKLFGVPFKKTVRKDALGRVLVLLAVQPVLRAEIGDAALRAHARAAEKHPAPRVL